MLKQKHRNINEIVVITHTQAHTHTCTCITTARIGYMALIQGVSQQKATNWWTCWQRGHQPHFPNCIAPSVE